ncbi:MAG: Grx4 family monothiol glutaredoxin [Thermoleophilaceae bacterium]
MDNAEIRDFIDGSIKQNEVMLFSKGTPEQPACGFSLRTSGALNALGVRYAALDILPDPRIREELSGLSGWPTIPQLFVKGELVGGCDIVMELYENGELAQLMGVDMPEEDDEPAATAASVAAAPLTDEEIPAQQSNIPLENNLSK